MRELTPAVVLRLARTMPRSDAPGIGLHCFHYTRLSRRRSLIVTKFLSSPPLVPRDDAVIVEIDYRDRSVTREKLSRIDTVLVGLTKIYGDVRFLLGAIGALRRNRVRPSIIHVHSANYLLAGWLLRIIYRVPLCLNFGGTELLRARQIPYYRWMFRRLDRGFYVARHMEEQLFRMMDPERCTYTGNGVDHDLFFASANPKRCDEIICVGNLRWQKDYANLLAAFSKIAQRFSTFRIRIFGEGPERAALEQQITALGLDGRILLEGMQPQEAIRQALQDATCFVICSKSEGFPKALIEAMACGLPVVATDAGECSVVLDSICETAPVGDSNALANALIRLIADPDLQAITSAACLKRSQDFSWQRVADIVEAAYDEMER